ncbi:MAG: PAS domain-containing protein [Spirochaetaceae bacterium]|jgi:two-component system phosphate regulon sensor histidine kinase PhoR|nr:PAS domain-containing protein [Spirochaetaceae bacterium]
MYISTGESSRAEARLEVLLNTVSDGVLITDSQLILRSVNPKARILFGFGEQRLGKLSLLEGTRSIELETLAREALSQNRPVKRDLKLYTSGEQRYFHVTGSPLGEAEKEALLVLTEFTRLHKLEQVRKDFAANVSHELRTPIQLIKGFAETLLDALPEDPAQLRHYIGIILKNAHSMENLSTDLLTLVSLEEGEALPFTMEETLVYPLLEEAMASAALGAGKKNITLCLNCSEELKAVMYGPFILQGVINLLDNGIKYSPAGGTVRLGAEILGDELVISVADKGIGIPAKHLSRIFERFYRVDGSRHRDQPGTGLGLAIVRHIAEIHQGTASAESHAGEGSVFRIRIPLAPRRGA